MTTLLVDGDIFIYRCALHAQETVDWGDGLICSWANTFTAQRYLKHTLTTLQSTLNADHMIIALSSPVNFRKNLDPTYKGNRRNREPLLVHKNLREFVKTTFAFQELSGLEGDDVLGILATTPDGKNAVETGTDKSADELGTGEPVIVSIDKDLQQIPGRHYNFDKPDLGVNEVTSHQATLFFYTQVLTGDATDGYSGCPGIGAKGAKILEGVTTSTEAWESIVKAYEKAGLSENDALLQARLARILRHGDYSLSTGVTLWTPEGISTW